MGIGPSTKETTLHHFRDPLVEIVSADKEIDLLGIIVEGTPEINRDKVFVAQRSAAMVEAMRADGAIVSIDSWGNSHIDFTSLIEAIGKKKVPTVGMSFVGNQAAFVVTNKYMDTIIDFNKTQSGIETTVVGENNVVEMDAIKALAILKLKMKKKEEVKEHSEDEIKLRKLCMKTFYINQVLFGEKNKIDKDVLYINKAMEGEASKEDHRIESLKINIIPPANHDMFINSILDFSPIATKVIGEAGEGVTHALTGVAVMITGVETCGFQAANIGSSEGILKEQVQFGRRGTPSEKDIIIHVDVVLKDGEGRTRAGIMAAHKACDKIVQGIRDCLKDMNHTLPDEKHEYFDIIRPGRKKVVIIKQVSGLGCMYDTGVFPYEPGGFIGCRSIIDLGNMPLMLSSNEYRDGAIRAMS